MTPDEAVSLTFPAFLMLERELAEVVKGFRGTDATG